MLLKKRRSCKDCGAYLVMTEDLEVYWTGGLWENQRFIVTQTPKKRMGRPDEKRGGGMTVGKPPIAGFNPVDTPCLGCIME